MNGRRPLAALLAELGDSVQSMTTLPGVRPQSLSMSLPIDLRFGFLGGSPAIFGDVPLFRTRTAFDPELTLLRVDWHAVPLAVENAS